MIVTNYWNCAWRSLTKKKGFSVVNIVGLAIGMAAALLILTYVAFESATTICTAGRIVSSGLKPGFMRTGADG